MLILFKDNRQTIKAIYIPLADHYPGIVAYEKYRDQMKHADYTIERMKSWPLLRAYFMSGEVDMAYIICPQAMDMFGEKLSEGDSMPARCSFCAKTRDEVRKLFVGKAHARVCDECVVRLRSATP